MINALTIFTTIFAKAKLSCAIIGLQEVVVMGKGHFVDVISPLEPP